MEGVPRIPMMSFPMRRNADTPHFKSRLKSYISNHFNEDPESYGNEVHELESLRASAVHVSKDYSGCSTLKKYFCQLNFLKSRFPMNEEGTCAISFSWYDVFTENVHGWSDVDFEMSCVLYNIGALHSELGALDNRQTAEGMKTSCTHFQCAAWAFSHLRHNYQKFFTPDVSPDMLNILMNVCLAQAQECILEKSLIDNRKSTITAKVALQIVEYYSTALRIIDGMLKDSSQYSDKLIKAVKKWRKLVELKVHYYGCIAYLYRGIQAEDQTKWGERVTMYKAAVEKLNECLKLGKNMDKTDPVHDTIQFTLDVVGGKVAIAEKENEFIYHEKVPDLETVMSDVKAVSLVKGIPFKFDDVQVAGPDIFGRLVPMEAHEASSMYSEEKAKVLRTYSRKIEEKNETLDKFVIPLQLEQLELHDSDKIPQELIDCCAALSVNQDAVKRLSDLMAQLSSLFHDVEANLEEIQDHLGDQEKKEKEYQEVVGNRPPNNIINESTREFQKCQSAQAVAAESNKTLHEAMVAHVANLTILMKPLNEVMKHIPKFDELEKNEEALARMKKLSGKVNEMRKQREMLESQLRDSILNDDITKSLVVKKGEDIDAVFKEELQKHDKVTQVLDQNLLAQDNIIRALTEANAEYAETRKATVEIKRKRDKVIQSFLDSYEAYDELTAKCNKGIEFYTKLNSNVEKLLQRVRSVCKVQNEERDSNMDRIIRKANPVMPPSHLSGATGYNNMPGYNPAHAPLPTSYTTPPISAATTPTPISRPSTGGHLKLKDYLAMKKEGQTTADLAASMKITNPASYDPAMQAPTSMVPPSSYDPTVQMTHPMSSPQVNPYDPKNQYQHTAPAATPPPVSYDPNAQLPHSGMPTVPTSTSYNMNNQLPQQSMLPNHVPISAPYDPSVYIAQNSMPAVHSSGAYQNPSIPVSHAHVPVSSATASMVYGQMGQTHVVAQPPISSASSYVPNVYSPMPPNPVSMPGQMPPQINQAPIPTPSVPYHPTGQYMHTGVPPVSAPVNYNNAAIHPKISTPPPHQPVNTGSPKMDGYNTGYNIDPVNMGVRPPPIGSEDAAKDSVCNYPYQNQSASQQRSNNFVPPPSANTGTFYGQPANSSGGYPNTSYSEATPTYDYSSYSQTSFLAQYVRQNQGYLSSKAGQQQQGSTFPSSVNYGAVNASGFTQNQVQPGSAQYEQGNQYNSQNNMQQWQQQQNPGTSVVGQVADQSQTMHQQQPVYPSQQQQPPSTYPQQYNYGSMQQPHQQNFVQQPATNYYPPNSTVQPTSTGQPAGQYQVHQPQINQSPAPVAPPPQVKQPAANKSLGSNLDLLSDIDFHVLPAVEPLAPNVLPGASSSPAHTAKTEVPSTNTQVSVYQNLPVAPAVVTFAVVCPTSVPDAPVPNQIENVPIKCDLKSPIRSDPLDDPSTLEKFKYDVEILEKSVNALIGKNTSVPTLDLKWKQLMEMQTVHNAKRSISVARCYPMKNRFPDILPYDETRVSIPDTKDDYINASFINELSPSSYPLIATQAPLPATMTDFWHMIWQHHVELVVCLSSDTELKDYYWPREKNGSLTFGSLEIVLMSANKKKYFVERIMSLIHRGQNHNRIIVHLQMTEWNIHTLPIRPGPVVTFIKEVNNYYHQQRNLNRPVVVHCVPGVGKTGAFCVLSAAIREINNGLGIPNILEIAGAATKQRKGVMNDKEYLKFVYSTLLYFCMDILKKKGLVSAFSNFNDYCDQSPKLDMTTPSEDVMQDISKLLVSMSTSKQDTRTFVTSGESLGMTTSLNSSPVHARRSYSVSSEIIKPKLSYSDIPDALTNIDPVTFRIPSNDAVDEVLNKRQTFENNKGALFERANGKQQDPLSSLDPLWTLHK